MLGVYVSIPIACFRKGLAREYLETEALPPPATCYGFLLSLIGELDRKRHIGVRIAPAVLNDLKISVVLRTVWRVKSKPLGASGNARPDYQQLLTGSTKEEPFIALLMWLDSSDEGSSANLEARVRQALRNPESVTRFGGLSLGESAHMVDEVSDWDRVKARFPGANSRAFLSAPRGRLTLPVWVDHVGSAGTRYATGNLVARPAGDPPPIELLPIISPETHP